MFQHGLNVKRMVDIFEPVPIETADAKTKSKSPAIIEQRGDQMTIGDNMPSASEKTERKVFVLKPGKMSMLNFAMESGTEEIVAVLRKAGAR